MCSICTVPVQPSTLVRVRLVGAPDQMDARNDERLNHRRVGREHHEGILKSAREHHLRTITACQNQDVVSGASLLSAMDMSFMFFDTVFY